MTALKFFWKTHRWTGLTLGLIFLLTAGTGLLLLWKKEFDALQPPTRSGAEGTVADFLPLSDVFRIVLAQEHADFRTAEDIDRIDVRPGKRVYKVRSKHNDTEIQVDAIGGTVLSTDVRNSDFLERLHDGSWIGDGFKVFAMPLAAIGLLYLVFSGYWMWLHPKLRRRAILRRHAERKRKLRERIKAGR